jgi:bile acid:Na+ symporter, BASS family
MLLKRIENNFIIFFLSAIAIGLIFPNYTKPLQHYIASFLMLIMFFTFLKLDVKDILSHIKKPLLLAYILFLNLILIPIVVYFLAMPLEKDLRISLLLLAALPTGVSATALTDIVKGKASLSLILSILSSLLVPFTMIGVFYLTLKTKIEIEYLNIFKTLLEIILIPMIASQLTKYFYKNSTKIAQKYTGTISIIGISIMVTGVIGKEADYILAHKLEIIPFLVVLFILFFAFQMSGYFMVPWLKKDEKIALSVSKSAMNNGLGIVIATSFFSPEVTTIIILTYLPWLTNLYFYKFYRKYLP